MRRRLRRRPAPPRALTPKSTKRKAPGSDDSGALRVVPFGKAVIVLVPTGNPPSLRFGHPDVTFGRYRLSALGYCAGAAAFSGCALRVSHGRSPMRSEEEAERPGDGCPCVGAEEICGAPPLLSEGRNGGEHRGNHDGGSAGRARHGLDLLIPGRWGRRRCSGCPGRAQHRGRSSCCPVGGL